MRLLQPSSAQSESVQALILALTVMSLCIKRHLAYVTE
jgi:hypothetical protein